MKEISGTFTIFSWFFLIPILLLTKDTSFSIDSWKVASSNPYKYNLVDSTDTYTGQQIRILTPNINAANPYNSANPTPVILYAHGASEDHTSITTDGMKSATINALMDAGYIVASTNAHGNNWGNQSSVDDFNALAKYVRSNYNVKGMAMWSQSMGGLTGLQVVTQGNVDLVGWLGTYPVCNLANLYSLGTYVSQINTAYGITGSGLLTYANQTNGHDPVLKSAKAYKDIPMRFYASPSDTVVPKANNADALSAIVANSRSEAVTVVCSGNHGDASHFQPSDYAAFFNRCFSAENRAITQNMSNARVGDQASKKILNWVALSPNNLIGL